MSSDAVAAAAGAAADVHAQPMAAADAGTMPQTRAATAAGAGTLPQTGAATAAAETTQATGTRVALTIVLMAVGCVTLPFLYKAFHLDDTFFVWLGQEKLHDFFALGLANHAYEGNVFSLYIDTHPPLLASYLALLIRLFGASEAWLHLGFAVFPALAAVSMYFLGRRFTGRPLVAALLLVATPGFMVMSQSIMTDVPALSLWLAGIAAYVWAVDRDDDLKLLAAAAAFVSLAVLTTWQSFSLVPLLLAYALLQKRLSRKNAAPLLFALLVFCGIFVYYLAATGGLPKLSYSVGVSHDPVFIANKLLTTVSVIGGAGIFPLALAAGLLKGRREYAWFAGVVALLQIFFLLKVPSGQYTAASALLQAVFYGAGILVIYRLFNAGINSALKKRRDILDGDNVFLVLWIAGVMVYTVALLPYASSRYLLPLLPPVILMFVAYANKVFTERRAWTKFAAVCIVCTAAAGLAVAISDYQLSGVYRDFAASQAPQLQADGHQLWFAGEFGLRYYLEQDGAQYLTRDDNSPAPGDHVALSHGLIAYYISPQLQSRLQLVQSVNFTSRWPVRVQDPGSLAGFYDQFHGNLPYSLSGQPVETIDIYEVR